MSRRRQILVKLGVGSLVTLWISALIAWNSGFLFQDFALTKVLATVVLVGVAVFLTSQLAPAYVNWHKQIEPSDAPADLPFSEKVALAISHLRSRARRLRLVSMYALVLIVLVILSSIYLFQGEETLRSLREMADKGDPLFSQKANLVYAIELDKRRIAALRGDATPSGAQQPDPARYPEVPLLEPMLPYDTNTDEGQGFSCDLPCRETRIRVNETRLSDLERRIGRMLAMPPDARAHDLPISSVATKVASAILLVILVQLLIALYRYSTRLAAFYDSRADILLLAGASADTNVQTLVEFLRPDALGFERVAVGPFSDVIEAVRKSTRAPTQGEQ